MDWTFPIITSSPQLPYNFCLHRETYGSLKFPDSPHEYMPWSQTPVVSRTLATHGRFRLLNVSGTAAFRPLKSVGFPPILPELSCCPQLYIFRGSIQSLHPRSRPASDSRCRVCPRTSLLTCWLNISQAELSLRPVSFPLPEQALQKDD